MLVNAGESLMLHRRNSSTECSCSNHGRGELKAFIAHLTKEIEEYVVEV